MSDDKEVNISDEAVEVAARALYKGQPLYDEAAGVITGHKPWEWTEPSYQEAMLAEARAALAAAAPHLMAAAWDEGVAYVFEGGAEVPDENPYRSAGAVEVSPSGVAFIRTTAKKHIPDAPSAGAGE